MRPDLRLSQSDDIVRQLNSMMLDFDLGTPRHPLGPPIYDSLSAEPLEFYAARLQEVETSGGGDAVERIPCDQESRQIRAYVGNPAKPCAGGAEPLP